MRAFVVRARSAPTDSQQFLASIGQEAHTEILAHTLMNTIFITKSHREDVIIYLVLESTQDYSRTISFRSSELSHIGGFHEHALLKKIAKALDISKNMGKEQECGVEPGITVRTISFEKLVQELAGDYQLYMMDKKVLLFANRYLKATPAFCLQIIFRCPRRALTV